MIKQVLIMTTYGTVLFSREYTQAGGPDVVLTSGLFSAIYAMAEETQKEKISEMEMEQSKIYFKLREHDVLIIINADRRMDEDDVYDILEKIGDSFFKNYGPSDFTGELLNDFAPTCDQILLNKLWYATSKNSTNPIHDLKFMRDILVKPTRASYALYLGPQYIMIFLMTLIAFAGGIFLTRGSLNFLTVSWWLYIFDNEQYRKIILYMFLIGMYTFASYTLVYPSLFLLFAKDDEKLFRFLVSVLNWAMLTGVSIIFWSYAYVDFNIAVIALTVFYIVYPLIFTTSIYYYQDKDYFPLILLTSIVSTILVLVMFFYGATYIYAVLMALSWLSDQLPFYSFPNYIKEHTNPADQIRYYVSPPNGKIRLEVLLFHQTPATFMFFVFVYYLATVSSRLVTRRKNLGFIFGVSFFLTIFSQSLLVFLLNAL